MKFLIKPGWAWRRGRGRRAAAWSLLQVAAAVHEIHPLASGSDEPVAEPSLA